MYESKIPADENIFDDFFFRNDDRKRILEDMNLFVENSKTGFIMRYRGTFHFENY